MKKLYKLYPENGDECRFEMASVKSLTPMARVIKHDWENGGSETEKPSVTLLDNGNVLIIANADTDADGAPDAETIDPDYGSIKTSLSKPDWKGSGEYVNSRSIPYFVLPLNWEEKTGVEVKLGDLAKVSYQNKSVYAILADKGPENIIGELSIAAVEALGQSPWNSDKTRIVSGIAYGVSYEIAPDTLDLVSTIDFETIQAAGKLAFKDHPQIKRAEKYLEATWLEMNRTNEGRPTITAYNAGKPLFTRHIKGKADLIEFLNLFPNARTVLVAETDVKVIPDCPDTIDEKPPSPGSDAQKFVSYFKSNYEAVRSEVCTWFMKGGYADNPITNGCVAHQVSCLHLCDLRCPDYYTNESVRVSSFVLWAEANGWTRVERMSDLMPGDICVAGPNDELEDQEHVYCFYAYTDESKNYAHILHNQDFGLATRSLLGTSNAYPWRFALRMPNSNH
jgi:hypothetical protein